MIFEKIREMLIEWYKHSGDGWIPCIEVLDIINQIEAEYNNGWIKCEDKLPEPNKCCLVAYKVSGVMRIAIFLFNGIDFNQTEETEVIAWQPLPQPPKGE